MGKGTSRPTVRELKQLKERLEEVLTQAETAEARTAEYSRSAREELESAHEAKGELSQLINSANEQHGEAKQLSNEIYEFKHDVESLVSTMEGACGSAKKSVSDVKQWERERREKVKEFNQLKDKVESILPGATSSSLASAFHDRRSEFSTIKWVWALVFLLSVIGLFGVSFWQVSNLSEPITAMGDLWGFLLSRLPLIGPLIWLGVYASVRHGQALRLEEEYAHKEVLSKSFEGYKLQLSELDRSKRQGTSTSDLTSRTLEAIARHPSVVYDQAAGEGEVGVLSRMFGRHSKGSEK